MYTCWLVVPARQERLVIEPIFLKTNKLRLWSQGGIRADNQQHWPEHALSTTKNDSRACIHHVLIWLLLEARLTRMSYSVPHSAFSSGLTQDILQIGLSHRNSGQ